MTRLFITATDTGAGKTFVTADLARLLHRQGSDCLALKPIASGLDASGDNEDVSALLSAQNLSDSDAISLYRFRMPAAPLVAAGAEGARIDPDRLLSWCDARSSNKRVTLIEGVGGLMVPLAENYLVRDWLQQMPDARVVLVIGGRLGCMNHALLTLSELERMGRSPAWVIFNAVEGDDMARQCEATIRPWLPSASRTLQLPYGADSGPALLPLVEALSGA
jgi:dethiobiotin synthetase